MISVSFFLRNSFEVFGDKTLKFSVIKIEETVIKLEEMVIKTRGRESPI